MVAYDDLVRAGIIIDKPVRPELRTEEEDDESDYEAAVDEGDDDL